MTRQLASVVIVGALLWPARGLAQADPWPSQSDADFFKTEDDRPPPRPKERWYGWQTLLADGAAISIGVAAIAADTPGLFAGSAVAYLLAPPMIHLHHARGGAAGGSLGLRLGGPLLGAVIGGGSCEESSGACASWGLVVGAVAAMLIDAGYLAWEVVPVATVSPGHAWFGASAPF
jgi:hypothetical protein